jgi:hypothetical protein
MKEEIGLIENRFAAFKKQAHSDKEAAEAEMAR